MVEYDTKVDMGYVTSVTDCVRTCGWVGTHVVIMHMSLRGNSRQRRTLQQE